MDDRLRAAVQGSAPELEALADAWLRSCCCAERLDRESVLRSWAAKVEAGWTALEAEEFLKKEMTR